MKNVFIYTETETLVADKAKINFWPWGIDAIVEMESRTVKVQIPWAKINMIEEVIALS